MSRFFILLLLVPVTAGARDDETELFEPPLSGRPTRFSGAVGVFRVSTEAEPASVQVEKPLRLIVRITASGKVLVPPARPDLAGDPLFASRFHIEAADPPAKQSANTWEFWYLLKPRSVAVKEVPEVAFCYFDPSFGADARGYQTSYSDAITLTVTPVSTELPKVDGAESAAIPEHLLEQKRGDQVLRRDAPWQLPGAPVLILFLLAPPAGCAVWYLAWRHVRPDSARQAHRRRSRAANRALKALQRSATGADEVATTVAQYLRERLGLASATPTPAEVQALLQQAGAPEQFLAAGRELFAACDAARYAPAAAGRGLAEESVAFILAVEAEPWSSLS